MVVHCGGPCCIACWGAGLVGAQVLQAALGGGGRGRCAELAQGACVRGLSHEAQHLRGKFVARVRARVCVCLRANTYAFVCMECTCSFSRSV